MQSAEPPYMWRLTDQSAAPSNRRHRSSTLSAQSQSSANSLLEPDSKHVLPRKRSSTGVTNRLRRPSPMCREYLFKVLVVGELSTGKTSFIRRYVHQFFNAHYRATIGVDFALKVIQWNESNLLRIQMWDIAGQERFGQMTRVYYKDAVGALVVFDVSKPQTFEAVVKWKVDIDSKVTCPDGSNIPCVLLANKSDEEKAGSLGEPSFLNQFCADNGFVGWFYTSPKEDLNIEQSAKFLLKHIIRQMKQLEDSTSITDDSLDTNAILTLDDRDQMPKKSKSIAFNCC